MDLFRFCIYILVSNLRVVIFYVIYLVLFFSVFFVSVIGSADVPTSGP